MRGDSLFADAPDRAHTSPHGAGLSTRWISWIGARDLALSPLAFLPVSESGLAQFDAALTELCDLAPLLKEPLLHACAVVVAADGVVNVREAELLRATADSLGCPMPPLLPGQTLL